MCSQGSKDNILGARQNILIILPQVNCRNNNWGASEPEQGGDQPFPGQDCGKESSYMHQCR